MKHKTIISKFSHLIIAIVLIIISVIWHLYIADNIKGFYNISEWGAYLLVGPIAYFIVRFFSKSKINIVKVLFYCYLGVLLSIFLSIDYVNSFLTYKVLASSIGVIITWLIFRKKPRKEDGKILT